MMIKWQDCIKESTTTTSQKEKVENVQNKRVEGEE
jgi:hypothetical protein